MSFTMKWLIATMLIGYASTTLAARAWVGEVSVASITFAKADSGCGLNGGACMKIHFKTGFKGCQFVALVRTTLISNTLKLWLSCLSPRIKNSDFMLVMNFVRTQTELV